MVASFEYIEKRIEAFQKAAELNLQNPFRLGNIIQLGGEKADEVVVTGDLHGRRRNFNQIKKIADLANNPKRHVVLQEVCHGGPTYPTNGGCMSHGMLEDVARYKVEFPDQVHFLLGNHELAELTEYPIQKNNQMLNMLFRLGMQQMYGIASEKVREAFIPFIRSCPLAVRTEGGVFISHSIPPDVERYKFDTSIFTRKLDPQEYYQREGIFELVWGRDYCEENAENFAKLVKAKVLITGHEPCDEGFATPNSLQVVLDSCCDHPKCVILPVGEPLTQNDVVFRLQNIE